MKRIQILAVALGLTLTLHGTRAALAWPGATLLQGGIPITYEGKVIGGSGNTPQEDEDIAKVGAASAAPAIAESRAK